MKTNFNFDEPKTSEASADCQLCDLRPDEAGLVLEVDASAPAGRRLLDLGFLPQTPVRALRRAPLGDPVVYELRGYRICLRRSDAARVRVSRS